MLSGEIRCACRRDINKVPKFTCNFVTYVRDVYIVAFIARYKEVKTLLIKCTVFGLCLPVDLCGIFCLLPWKNDCFSANWKCSVRVTFLYGL